MALDIIAWHDRNSANHQQMLTTWAAKGYRTLSLTVYGERNDPRYASVMVKRPVVLATEQHFGLSTAQFQAKFNEMAAKGWGPYLLSATGPANDPLIAACFTPMNPIPLTRFGITADDLDKLNDEQMLNGGILKSADAYGTPSDTRFIAVWHPNPERISWNCDAIVDDPTIAQQRFNAITSAGGRPVLMAMAPGGGLLQCFVDTSVGAWTARANLTSQQYQDEVNKMGATGLAPVAVAAQGTGNAARFLAIFASTEAVEPRTFRATGPTTVASIDDAMKVYMQAHNLRNASLAITKGARLVYAKGYTWAEASYPTVLPTTLFRQASVSKTIVALAMYQILETNPKITLDTTMQSVLNLQVPAGAAQPDPKFAKVTIRHLLESNSGINRDGIWQDVDAAKAFGGTNKLPVTPMQLAQHIASLPMDKDHQPGDTHNVVYNNTGYFLLSQVVAKLRGANSFEEAITPTLLKPLGISRIRQSRSLASAQASDEAHYQLRHLSKKNDKGVLETTQRAYGTWWSVRTPDQPLVPSQYGTWSSENHDGAGGLSAAAVDLARVVAMFSSGTANPVLKPATLNQLFDNAVTCTKTYTGPNADPSKNEAHGYHGLDWAQANDQAKHLYRAAKGGYLPASQNGFSFDTGDLGLVICIGSNQAEGVMLNWETAVRPLANQQNWGTTDLFTLPEFGSMKSLVPATGIPIPVVSFPQPKLTILDAMKAQQTVVARLNGRLGMRPAERPVVERELSNVR